MQQKYIGKHSPNIIPSCELNKSTNYETLLPTKEWKFCWTAELYLEVPSHSYTVNRAAAYSLSNKVQTYSKLLRHSSILFTEY